MVTLLPERESFGAVLGRALGGAAGQTVGGYYEGKRKEEEFAQKMQLQKLKQRQERKDLGQTFGNILEEMKSLKEHVGPFKIGALNPYSETSGKRSQINTLRLSLEGLFRDLTLKGQFPKAIYERILKELPQSSDTEEKYLNKIEGIQKILDSEINPTDKTPKKSEVKEGEKEGKVKFNHQNKEHVAKYNQLEKEFKGDAKKINEALAREFTL